MLISVISCTCTHPEDLKNIKIPETALYNLFFPFSSALCLLQGNCSQLFLNECQFRPLWDSPHGGLPSKTIRPVSKQNRLLVTSVSFA